MNVQRAETFWQRLLGLMFKRQMPVHDALLIRNCTSVHTFFMRFPIDVVFLDAAGAIVKIQPNVRPWRVSLGGTGARHVLELAAGTAQALAWSPALSLPEIGIALW